MNLKVRGPFEELSGYGEASRLIRRSISLTNTSSDGKVTHHLYVHPPPYDMYKFKGKQISYFYWEADKYPKEWISQLINVDQIIAPCNLNKASLQEEFPNRKIYIVPTPISREKIVEKIDKKSFTFYSIFQWHNRKGWRELLHAYFSEFKDTDDVTLYIKTNPIGRNGLGKLEIINDYNSIANLYLNKSKVILDLGVKSQIFIESMHNSFDSYVSPHYGEGWGMSIHAAMKYEKTIISSNFGGITELLDDKSYFRIDGDIQSVRDMEWNSLYNDTQKWFKPDVDSLRRSLRFVYENDTSKYGINAAKICEKTYIDIVSKDFERVIVNEYS